MSPTLANCPITQVQSFEPSALQNGTEMTVMALKGDPPTFSSWGVWYSWTQELMSSTCRVLAVQLSYTVELCQLGLSKLIQQGLKQAIPKVHIPFATRVMMSLHPQLLGSREVEGQESWEGRWPFGMWANHFNLLCFPTRLSEKRCLKWRLSDSHYYLMGIKVWGGLRPTDYIKPR